MPVCTVCSGTDFICESGYYFCSECQTQTQDIRVEVLEIEDLPGDVHEEIKAEDVRGVKRKDRDGEPDVGADITTWEGFNLCLVGLVDELVSLGVKPTFKTTILKLWSAYLKKMEVAFMGDSSVFPKLGPNFKKNDARLIYGYAEEKMTRVKVEKKEGKEGEDPNDVAGAPDDKGLNKRRIRGKTKSLLRQNYAKILQDMSVASQTLTDVTLDMLAVSSIADEDKKPCELQFNAEHDKLQDIKDSTALSFHPGVLVRNKLLYLIYLGLIMTDEKVKLSDLLRWISEKHISYSHLQKFFSSLGQLRGDNFQVFICQQPAPQYHSLLYGCGRLASYVGLKAIKPPSMKDLIQHYTAELNLPSQVCLLAQRLLALLPAPKAFVPTVSKNMPNWEGRAMAHIVISLKILFGLDDATEHQNSRIARKLNEVLVSQNESTELFVWDDWERFCTLRRTAFMLLHEPNQYQLRDSTSVYQNVEASISGWRNAVYNPGIHTQRKVLLSEIYRKFIESLRGSNDLETDKITFPCTTSPFSSYVEIISRAYQEGRITLDADEWNQVIGGLNLEMLNQSFKEKSIDYLTHPNEYIEWAQLHGLHVGLHNGAAVSSIWATSQEDSNQPSETMCYRVKIFMDQVDKLPAQNLPLQGKAKPTLQLRPFNLHKPIILPKTAGSGQNTPLPNISDMKIGADEEVEVKRLVGTPRPPWADSKNTKKTRKSQEPLPQEEEVNMLYTPHTEYWMLHFKTQHLNSDAPSEHVSKLPLSFANLLEECAYLLEMTPFTLYKEVIYVEKLHRLFFDFLSGKSEFKFNEEARILQLKDSW